MKYDLFISDFDGTLVRADGTNLGAHQRGHRKIPSSGRHFHHLHGAHGPVHSAARQRARHRLGPRHRFQGSVVYDMGTEQVLSSGHFPLQAALPLIRMLEEENLHIHIYTLWHLYTNIRDEMLALYEKVCGVRCEVPDCPLSEFAEREKLDIVKVLVMVEPEKREALRERLSQSLGEEYYVTSSSNGSSKSCPRAKTRGRRSPSFPNTIISQRTHRGGGRSAQRSSHARSGGREVCRFERRGKH